jgi:MoaA/NifB/PqqE/SkfB family radical SAM enzyme
MNYSLTLLITESCNISCRHCLLGDRDLLHSKKNMSFEDAANYIDQMAEISAAENASFHVRFTGGEPLLRYPEILEFIRYARQKGAKEIGSMSNGFWGKDLNHARQLVLELKKVGLSSLCFSFDDFHQEYMPVSTVRNAIQACRDNSLDYQIKCVVTQKTRRLPEVLSDLGDLLLNQAVVVQEIPCYPEGSASAIPPEDLFYQEGIPGQPCPSGLMLAVLPDGTTFPCCGACWNHRLVMGNAKNEALRGLFDKMRHGSLMRILREKGPSFFVPFYEKCGHPLPEHRYVSYCDLCKAVLTHPCFEEIEPLVSDAWRREYLANVFSALLGDESKALTSGL